MNLILLLIIIAIIIILIWALRNPNESEAIEKKQSKEIEPDKILRRRAADREIEKEFDETEESRIGRRSTDSQPDKTISSDTDNFELPYSAEEIIPETSRFRVYRQILRNAQNFAKKNEFNTSVSLYEGVHARINETEVRRKIDENIAYLKNHIKPADESDESEKLNTEKIIDEKKVTEKIINHLKEEITELQNLPSPKEQIEYYKIQHEIEKIKAQMVNSEISELSKLQDELSDIKTSIQELNNEKNSTTDQLERFKNELNEETAKRTEDDINNLENIKDEINNLNHNLQNLSVQTIPDTEKMPETLQAMDVTHSGILDGIKKIKIEKPEEIPFPYAELLTDDDLIEVEPQIIEKKPEIPVQEDLISDESESVDETPAPPEEPITAETEALTQDIKPAQPEPEILTEVTEPAAEQTAEQEELKEEVELTEELPPEEPVTAKTEALAQDIKPAQPEHEILTEVTEPAAEQTAEQEELKEEVELTEELPPEEPVTAKTEALTQDIKPAQPEPEVLTEVTEPAAEQTAEQEELKEEVELTEELPPEEPVTAKTEALAQDIKPAQPEHEILTEVTEPAAEQTAEQEELKEEVELTEELPPEEPVTAKTEALTQDIKPAQPEPEVLTETTEPAAEQTIKETTEKNKKLEHSEDYDDPNDFELMNEYMQEESPDEDSLTDEEIFEKILQDDREKTHFGEDNIEIIGEKHDSDGEYSYMTKEEERRRTEDENFYRNFLKTDRKKKKELPILKVTYDFTRLPDEASLSREKNILEYAFYKYKPMLEKAQIYIKHRKVRDAINYYKVVQAQNIPPEFKSMIRKNINDLTEYLEKYLSSD